MKLEVCRASLPSHLIMSDRNIFFHSQTSELTMYMSLHTEFLQSACNLYRIFLPGGARETAPARVLETVPSDLATEWQRLAVSSAYTLASTWRRLGEMKSTGSLQLQGGIMPLSPVTCVSIHQCTKVLLIAKRYGLYSGLVGPTAIAAGGTIILNDGVVDALCESNIAVLNDLAGIAPIAAVIQRGIKNMVSSSRRDVALGSTSRDEAPVMNEIQRENILSRYHVLAMGISSSTNTTNRSEDDPITITHETSETIPTPSLPLATRHEEEDMGVEDAAMADVHSSTQRTRPSRLMSESNSAMGSQKEARDSTIRSEETMTGLHRQQIQLDQTQSLGKIANVAEPAHQSSTAFLNNTTRAEQVFTPRTINVAHSLLGLDADHTIEASQYSMNGELDWFMLNYFPQDADADTLI